MRHIPATGNAGRGSKSGITAGAETQAIRYNFVREAGTYPNTATLGRVLRQEIKAEQADEALAYELPKTTGKLAAHIQGPELWEGAAAHSRRQSGGGFFVVSTYQGGDAEMRNHAGRRRKRRSRHKQSSYSAASLQRGVWLREMRDAVLR